MAFVKILLTWSRDSKFSTAGPTIWTPPRTRRRTKSTSVSAAFSESHKPLSLSKSHLPTCEMRKMANQNVNTTGTKLRSASARSPKDKHDSCATRNQGQVGQDRVDVVQYEVAHHINVQHVVNEEYMKCKQTAPATAPLERRRTALSHHTPKFSGKYEVRMNRGLWWNKIDLKVKFCHVFCCRKFWQLFGPVLIWSNFQRYKITLNI